MTLRARRDPVPAPPVSSTSERRSIISRTPIIIASASVASSFPVVFQAVFRAIGY
jgi:hypothetical protein